MRPLAFGVPCGRVHGLCPPSPSAIRASCAVLRGTCRDDAQDQCDSEGGYRQDEPEDEKGIAPEDQAIRNEDVSLVRAAIGELDETDNTLVTLRDIEGLSYEEISEVLDMKLGSVKSHLHRARCRLKEMLKDRVAG